MKDEPTRRGRTIFKQRDITRAVRSAQAAGLAVGGIEVVTKDGTIIRILGESEQATDKKLDAILARLDVLLSQLK